MQRDQKDRRALSGLRYGRERPLLAPRAPVLLDMSYIRQFPVAGYYK